MYVTHANSDVAFHSDAHQYIGSDSAPIRLCRLLVDAWLRSVERRTEAAIRQLDHAGLLEDFEASRRN